MPVDKILEFNFGLYFNRISNLTCKLRHFYASLNYSECSWLLVVVSFDRFLSISYPTRFLFRKKMTFQILTCLFTIGFNVSFYTSSWFYHLNETITTSQPNNQTKFIIECKSSGFWFDIKKMLHQILIPFFIMTTLSLLTISKLYRSRKIQPFKSNNHNNSNNNSSSKTIGNDRKFTITSIAISLLFLLFNFPYFLFYMINQYSNLFVNLNDLFKFIEGLTFFLLYINLGFTFYVSEGDRNSFICAERYQNSIKL
jgi:hypothetical protein